MNRDRQQLFGEGMAQLSKNWHICLWPLEDCSKKAIRAHSIQNNVVLERLCENGHVVMPKLSISLEKPPKVEFQFIGRNKATTFTGLCSEHDSAMFTEIELNEIDLDSPLHCFLLAYRALLKETHSCRKAARDTQLNYLAGVSNGVYPDGPHPAGEGAIELIIAAYNLDKPKIIFDESYASSKYQNICHEALYLDIEPSVAVNSMFSTDILSDTTDSLVYLTLNVFPTAVGRTAVLFSYVAEHADEAARYLDKMKALEGQPLLLELSRLILRKCENFAVSPKIYHSYSDSQEKKMLDFYIRNSNGQEYESNDPKICLFGAV